MNQKKKKKTKPPINLATLEDKINILNFMKDDFEKILDKENEIHGLVTKHHKNKEEKALNEKEKIDIILSELVLSCEEKKNQLNKYIKTASEMISQNKEIIEKEKEETENLILEKNQEINSMQEKIDLAKCFYNDVNNTVVQLFNNLDLFLKNKIDVDLNINYLQKMSKAEKKMDSKPRGQDTQDPEEQIGGHKRQNEGEDKFLQQLCHSMDEYEKKMWRIKSFMQENELNHLTNLLLNQKGSDDGLPAKLPGIPQIEEKNMNRQERSGSGYAHSTESKRVVYEDGCMGKTGQSELANDASGEVVSSEGQMEEEDEFNDDEETDEEEDEDDVVEDEEDEEDDMDDENDDSDDEEESLDDHTDDDDEEHVEEEEGGVDHDTSTENAQRKEFNTPAESEDNFNDSQQSKREVLEEKTYDHIEKKCSGIKILNDAETAIKSFSSDVYKKILSDNMSTLMEKIKKIDYDYVSYFEKKLKS
ncbi:conserved Plasmodium protein, unknown function [Plasmodium knowlesi strain H]|uniref:Uncharacterized protein n=3 Tax=Plasmodium knowlesi TaxID=5850 RepID=A0A5K1UC01_PLAKH|nr:conserved Plasmodium protein, unknown function [Plasmodium knowlesi strain H]OTN65520.1 Uncharacterized protein PKNOH_S110094900 [Plasmodium knowlesi]CAA9989568.1 conserved Plasmodium protein, unknown function [Plasmodium knowlesi strain H]SBO22606.1 conserved Plasmodium protein, unknown function [Plasmodium knowlesi strain H]SBO23456.1 conserved Plasmodium protein, unknown function [Plasmodium knowlesi strain H]VVS79042.1 conserved Plasmodium protein, unknown function [Plasmodium knowlesi |eukprot:XP_002260293.1 hypothetical protein, conserved in Plasmodium species [Plasmodium knowlesi strain H]